MPKRKTKPEPTPSADPEPTPPTPGPAVVAPADVHRLLGLPEPYDQPKAPPPWPGYATFWDPGVSVRDLQARHPDLFCRYMAPWVAGQAFARQTDVRAWRQVKPLAAGPGLTFGDQSKRLSAGDGPPSARELIAYLVVHFLATGERLGVPRLRCRDVQPSGLRVVVGPFGDWGLQIATVGDGRASPGVGLADVFTPPAPRRKR